MTRSGATAGRRSTSRESGPILHVPDAETVCPHRARDGLLRRKNSAAKQCTNAPLHGNRIAADKQHEAFIGRA